MLASGSSAPSLAVYVALAFMTLLLGRLSLRLRSFWRYVPSTNLPEAVWRVRAYRPMAIVTGWCFVGTGWCFVLYSYFPKFGLGAIAFLAGLATISGLLLTTSIVFMGRPQALMPPALRR